MRILAELREQGRAQDMQALVEHLPYARFLGIAVDRKGNEITTILPFSDHLVGNTQLRALHGGVIGAFLEITSIVQLLFDTSCERLPKTIDISIDYLRSGKPVETYGRAIVTRHGRAHRDLAGVARGAGGGIARPLSADAGVTRLQNLVPISTCIITSDVLSPVRSSTIAKSDHSRGLTCHRTPSVPCRAARNAACTAATG